MNHRTPLLVLLVFSILYLPAWSAEGLAPAIVRGEIGNVKYAAALTPEGWVGNQRWAWMGSFNEGVATVQEKAGGKVGLIDVAGKMVLPLEFDEIGASTSGMIPVKKDGKFGYVDRSGKEVLPLTVEWSGCKPFVLGLAPVKKGDLWGFIDSTGTFVIPPRYEDAWQFDAASGLSRIQKGGLWGWIDRNGIEKIATVWYAARDFRGGRARVLREKDGLYGYVDTIGALVIPLKFADGGDFHDGYASVSDGEVAGIGTLKLINLNGTEIASIGPYKAEQHYMGAVKFRGPVSRGMVKLWARDDRTFLAHHNWGLLGMDGTLRERPIWEEIFHSPNAYTVLRQQHGEAEFGMPTYKVRMDDGSTSQFYPLPADYIEDVSDTGALTRTGTRNLYSRFPFPVSPEFDDNAVRVPPFRRLPERNYKKVYLIAWSGLNDHAGFLGGTARVADAFASWGAEAHVLLPKDDIGILQKQMAARKISNKLRIHEARITELKRLVKMIKNDRIGGEFIAVTFFFGSHGAEDGIFGSDGYVIAGPSGKDSQGREYHCNLTGDVLAFVARELKDCDIRVLNATCFGANTDDIFQSSLLNACAEVDGSGGLFATSSVIANWHMPGRVRLDEKYWGSEFVARKDVSFLQASFAAMRTLNLGAVGDRLYDVPEPNAVPELRIPLNVSEVGEANVDSWNIGMTASERILYFDRLRRKRKFEIGALHGDYGYATPVILETDELDEGFFSLSSGNLALPSNTEFAALYNESRQQTEAFLARMSLGEGNRAILGLGESGRIDFARAAQTCNEASLGMLGKRSQVEYALRGDYKALTTELEKLSKAPNSKVVDLEKFGRLTKGEIAKKQAELSARIVQIQDSDYGEIQKAMVLIKRLGLMLDFLNDADVPQKRKELFAWYRANELMPLMPRTHVSN